MKNKILLFLILLVSPFFLMAGHAKPNMKTAVFAGGCFWCMESDFEKIEGVQEVVSGYLGGTGKNPTYQNYAHKGHIEVVKIYFDSSKISYQKLLEKFWVNIDPLDADGQFCDRGYEYSTAIFFDSEEQKTQALNSKQQIDDSGLLKQAVVTPIRKIETFYEAETYHQNYYQKNPLRYNYYRDGCGRDDRLMELWDEKKEIIWNKVQSSIYKKPSLEKIKERLTKLQYQVTQENATERAFNNEYWDNKKAGIYVDIVSGEPLFSSKEKFKSGTGWPSFTSPISNEMITEKEENSFFMSRIEIRSRWSDSHLGHLFNDGPAPTGLRYCINSASLRFVAKAELEKEGYGDYAHLFEK